MITWYGIRPAYEKAIIEERVEKISQLHNQVVSETDLRIQNWVNVIRDASSSIEKTPDEFDSILNTYIRLFPQIQLLRIVSQKTGEFAQIKQRSSDIEAIEESWKSNLVESNEIKGLAFNFIFEKNILYINYAFETKGDVLNLHVLIQDENLFRLISHISISEKTIVALWKNSELVFTNQQIDENITVEPAKIQRIEKKAINGKNGFLTYNSFSIAPYQFGIFVFENEITEPIQQLFFRSVIILAISILIIGLGVIIITFFIEKPILQIAEDIQPFGEYQFSKEITISSLPDLKPLSLIMEEVRKKLDHYQKINIDRILEEEERNRLLMKYANQMVAILDEKGQFVFANEKLDAFFQDIVFTLPNKWSALEKSRFITENKREKRKNKTDHAGLYYTVMDWEVNTISKHNYFFKVYKLDIKGSENNGSLIIFYDMTNELMMDMKRDELLAFIVHELKNPIASIIGFSQLIQSALTEKERERIYIEYILNSASEMNELINRILQISKLESKSFKLDKSPIFIRGVLQQIEDSFQAQCTEHKIRFEININEDAQFVLGSEILFVDALKNLVSNAIKYGDDNRSILIESKKEGNFILISITDYGFGIDSEFIDKIFDKFYRIKSTVERPGTGLGLSFVKEIMERHEGKVTVDSEKEFGTRFTLYFPVDEELIKLATAAEDINL